MPQPVFRFAPSPNGRLHLGHACSALLNAALAEKMDGRFLLRLEDIDTTRCTAALAQACLDDLRWLGLMWEEPVRIQSQHWEDYRAATAHLQEVGLLYPCFCSRSQVAAASTAADPDGAPLYAGTCRHLTARERAERLASGAPHSLRLDMAKARQLHPAPLTYLAFSPQDGTETSVSVTAEEWGDAILVRRETPTSYHLSVVVDDALQGITHVVRGKDLEAATSLHRLLQALLGLPSAAYHHHALLTDDSGGKLAKSKGSESIADLRERGISAKEIRDYLAEWLQ